MRIERTGGSDLSPELPNEHPPAARRAVICDRDDLTRSTVEGVLRDEGFEVVARLAEPRDVAASTAELRPDVVVLGIVDPEDDIRALAEITAQRIAPVVVLAATADPELVAGSRDAGALAFLTKPPSRAGLVPAVEVAIARFAEVGRLIAEVQSATVRLESRKIIDRAKGLLMTHRRMSEPEAFRWIQHTAMDRRKTSAAIAAQVVAELGEGPIRAAS